MKRRDAFTLTELLVLMAAGTMLSAVLVASLGDAKEKVRAAVCASNLREIGVAISMYANDHNDYYPPGYTGYSDWPLIIGPYLGKSLTFYGGDLYENSSRAFLCPSGVPSGAYNGLPVRLMYSAHPTLMPTSIPNHLYRRSRVARPTEVVLVTEGIQQAVYYSGGFDAAADFDHIIASVIAYPGIAPDTVMTMTALSRNNQDGPASNVGFIRFRHGENNVANFLFCDTHVEALAYGQVKFRNFYYDP